MISPETMEKIKAYLKDFLKFVIFDIISGAIMALVILHMTKRQVTAAA